MHCLLLWCGVWPGTLLLPPAPQQEVWFLLFPCNRNLARYPAGSVGVFSADNYHEIAPVYPRPHFISPFFINSFVYRLIFDAEWRIGPLRLRNQIPSKVVIIFEVKADEYAFGRHEDLPNIKFPAVPVSWSTTKCTAVKQEVRTGNTGGLPVPSRSIAEPYPGLILSKSLSLKQTSTMGSNDSRVKSIDEWVATTLRCRCLSMLQIELSIKRCTPTPPPLLNG